MRARNPGQLDAEAAAILFGMGWAQAATALRWNRQRGWANLRRAAGYYLLLTVKRKYHPGNLFRLNQNVT